MHPLENRIPPPLVALIIAAGMWANATSGLSLDVPDALKLGAAILIAAIGASFDILGLLAFRKARTTVNPLKPEKASALVTTGIYRITRNPMYVGLGLFLLAWAVWLASLWPLAGPILFVFYMNRFQIEPEERVLARRFGSEFEAYKARVRRWI